MSNDIKHYDFLRHFEYIDGVSFYRELFPMDSFQEEGDYSEKKPNGIAIEIDSKTKRISRYTITDDLECIRSMIGNFRTNHNQNFCFTSPISYVGRERKSINARYLYALVIEVDNIVEQDGKSKGLENLFYEIDKGFLPRPTFIVGSGSGVHLYFQFIKPIPLYKNIVEQLQRMKRHFTPYFWDKTITYSWKQDQIQFESIFQAFRIPNTATKNGAECLAFRCGEPVTIEYMNKFVKNESCTVDIVYKSELPLIEAKAKYPEWYDRRIVKGDKSVGHWTCHRGLYDWWKKRMFEGQIGHRYWCMFALCVYAKKSGIERSELEKDCMEFMKFYDSSSPIDNPFTETDVLSALQTFEDDGIFTYPINSIENRTALKIERNKRNYRKQELHLKLARTILEEKRKDKYWKNNPRKDKVVQDWKKQNPSRSKYACAKETGLSYKTVSKWWNIGD